MTELFVIYISLFSGCLWWYFYWPHRRYWIDRTRHKLFIIRDEFFDQAAEGNLSFDSGAYIDIRDTLNGMIRSLEEFSFARMLYMRFITLRSEVVLAVLERYSASLVASTSELSPTGQKIITDARRRMHLTFISYIVHTSLPLWTFFQVIWALTTILKFFGLTKDYFASKAVTISAQVQKPIDLEANIAGKDDDYATTGFSAGLNHAA